MKTKGELTTCDIWLTDDYSAREFDDYIFTIITAALETSRVSIIKSMNHRFIPYGETRVYILSASHLGYHTYPEHNYVSIDCYTCSGEGDSKEIMFNILELFKPMLKKYKLKTLTRGMSKGCTHV